MHLLPSISKAHQGTNCTPQHAPASLSDPKGVPACSCRGSTHWLCSNSRACMGPGSDREAAVGKSGSSLSWWKGFAVPTSALGLTSSVTAVAFSQMHGAVTFLQTRVGRNTTPMKASSWPAFPPHSKSRGSEKHYCLGFSLLIHS